MNAMSLPIPPAYACSPERHPSDAARVVANNALSQPELAAFAGTAKRLGYTLDVFVRIEEGYASSDGDGTSSHRVGVDVVASTADGWVAVVASPETTNGQWWGTTHCEVHLGGQHIDTEYVELPADAMLETWAHGLAPVEVRDWLAQYADCCGGTHFDQTFVDRLTAAVNDIEAGIIERSPQMRAQRREHTVARLARVDEALFELAEERNRLTAALSDTAL